MLRLTGILLPLSNILFLGLRRGGRLLVAW
jgi:hypothetical protein